MGFVEYLSFRYLDFAQNDYYNYLIIFIGVLIGGIFANVNFKMQRGTYFLNITLVGFGAALSQLVWIYGNTALANGFLFFCRIG